MKIVLKAIPIKDVVQDYADKGADGVFAYGGALSVRPAYQREFVYKDAQRAAVIETIRKNFPLNVMYWVKTNATEFEVLDGQQRTISLCEYVSGTFSVDYKYFHNLTPGEQEAFLSYELMVYVCEGTDREKLDWFKTINIAGEKLTDQELRNAIYTGAWLADAKRHFSRPGASCPAYAIGSKYLKGTPIRQDYLETALKWISSDDIEAYMSKHQCDSDAAELWEDFQAVIAWVEKTFPIYRKEMLGVDWGTLYDSYHTETLDTAILEAKVARLMEDEDVTNKKGIYPHVLTGETRHLSIRTFTDNHKREAYTRQAGVCPRCKATFAIGDMEGDHINPWSKGGKTIASNCQMLCQPCNRTKSGV